MSEYQYYEFHAIDRPLTEEEQRAVARLSSRVDPHPRRAVFTYSYSDFPGRAKEVLAKYYDAMLYLANWGSRQLMFRFPEALVDLDRMRQYHVETVGYLSNAITVSTVGEYTILNTQFHDEDDSSWIEGNGWLDSLVGKYNPVEHAWGVLENHWNGSVLDTVETALNFAQTMTWNAKHPVVVKLVEKTYQTGVRLTRKEMKELGSFGFRVALQADAPSASHLRV